MHQILIPIDPSAYTKTAFRYAVEIASHNKVILDGVAIIDNLSLAEAASTYVPLPLGNEEHLKQEQQLMEDAKEKANRELADFKELCKTKRLHCSAKLMVGRPDFVIEEAGKYADLIVTGMRNFFHFETSKSPEKTVSKIMHHTRTPLLIVPEVFKPVKKVLVTFDGSNPSIRAAQEFAKLTWNKEYEITILISHKSRSEGDELLQKLENYLSKHTRAKIKKQYSDENIISVFDNEFSGSTDLVVCGMHSQNILQKVFVGSFPEHLINLNKIPVLIAQ